eukprot:365965-Chlamydomonas_euryale.AAC.2
MFAGCVPNAHAAVQPKDGNRCAVRWMLLCVFVVPNEWLQARAEEERGEKGEDVRPHVQLFCTVANVFLVLPSPHLLDCGLRCVELFPGVPPATIARERAHAPQPRLLACRANHSTRFVACAVAARSLEPGEACSSPSPPKARMKAHPHHTHA